MIAFEWPSKSVAGGIERNWQYSFIIYVFSHQLFDMECFLISSEDEAKWFGKRWESNDDKTVRKWVWFDDFQMKTFWYFYLFKFTEMQFNRLKFLDQKAHGFKGIHL